MFKSKRLVSILCTCLLVLSIGSATAFEAEGLTLSSLDTNDPVLVKKMTVLTQELRVLVLRLMQIA